MKIVDDFPFQDFVVTNFCLKGFSNWNVIVFTVTNRHSHLVVLMKHVYQNISGVRI